MCAYDPVIRTVTATHASRGFSDLLDAVERGDTIAITRGGRVVAQIAPAVSTTGSALRAALAGVPTLDDDLEGDVAGATALLTTDESDPWHAG